MKLNPQKTALAVRAFFGLWHAVWGLLVALNLATPLLDWILSMHFLNNPYSVQPFGVVKWVTLVVVTTIVGYAVGYVFSLVWNKVHK